MVSNLTTLFLGKPQGSSLPVFRAHSFSSNCQLALLQSAEREYILHNRICRAHESFLGLLALGKRAFYYLL